MNNNDNINKHIEILDVKIQKLEKRLAAMMWERKKYIQFSIIPKDEIKTL